MLESGRTDTNCPKAGHLDFQISLVRQDTDFLSSAPLQVQLYVVCGLPAAFRHAGVAIFYKILRVPLALQPVL